MNFAKHSDLEGKHAFLGASTYSWTNYDIDRLANSYTNFQAKVRGTRLHALANELITLGIRLPNKKATLNMYVNDAIKCHMKTEQILYYSDNAYGTADAINFNKNFLSIYDYKSGRTAASMRQLEIYAAFFCLEYHYKPDEIETELRIYQSNEINVRNPPAEDIYIIMDKIITFDQHIEKLKMEA